MPSQLRTSRTEPIESEAVGFDWNLALAGGEGTRLAEYVERRFGQRTPKQYCRLLGRRSMLEHTLDRLNQLAPPWRTMTVIGTNHSEIAALQLAGRSDHVFCQPSSRDTGLAIYVAIAMIKHWHPNAVITLTPTDHYVAPAGKYVQQLACARRVASRLRDTVVILGVSPTEPDPELGYLTLGERTVEVPQVRAVTGFVEKPDVERARELGRRGALWNTMVTCGSAHALWELARAAEPHMIDILDSFVPLVGTPDESDAIEYIYRALLPVSFSRDILERQPTRLTAMELDGVEWSDWGKPERVETTLAQRRSRQMLATTHSL
jgi:mannose-1-phosphate guanylyltransferase